MLIDTHCHLDASEFDADRSEVIERARLAGVRCIVIPAVMRANFAMVQALAHATPGACYALGIHPLYVDQSSEEDLDALDAALTTARDDPKLVAIGEIGLDFFVTGPSQVKKHSLGEQQDAGEASGYFTAKTGNISPLHARQEWFYERQLDLAQRHGLPVLLHVRRSQDILLKHLRRRPPIGGIAHAFNGSFQQAEQFIKQGFVLGLGGAMTFEGALQIRRLAAQLPGTALVLETDAPDIPPAWLGRGPDGRPQPARNEPAETAGIARVLADLRNEPLETVVMRCAANAARVLPRLAYRCNQEDSDGAGR